MGKFSIILSDPAWQFKTYSNKGKGKSPEQHYDCMTLDDIKQLPVDDIAADNAALFLWCTWPMLPNGLEVMKAWGFRYSTCGFIWVKRNKKKPTYFTGCGYFTRANSEPCLLGIKGKPLPRLSHSVHQIIDTPIEEHSKKPDVVRERIVELFGDLPRIELFARQETPGWTAVGNEIDGKDIRDALLRL